MRRETSGPIDLPLVLSLYTRYVEDLRRVRAFEQQLYREYRGSSGADGARANPVSLSAPSRLLPPSMRRWVSDHVPLSVLIQARRVLKAVFPGRDLDPQADDVDCEITYLLIRHFRPESFVEISPCGGWSTTWILSGLRDAGRGHLYSYDLIDDATRTVPRSLSQGRWTFTKGDVRELVSTLPRSIDYLFLDADHSAGFAGWYLRTLFPRLQPGAIVSVDDIFHPELERRGEVGEIRAVLGWLQERKVPYFTAAPSADPDAYGALTRRKAELGMTDQIHDSTVNPSIYLRMR